MIHTIGFNDFKVLGQHASRPIFAMKITPPRDHVVIDLVYPPFIDTEKCFLDDGSVLVPMMEHLKEPKGDNWHTIKYEFGETIIAGYYRTL